MESKSSIPDLRQLLSLKGSSFVVAYLKIISWNLPEKARTIKKIVSLNDRSLGIPQGEKGMLAAKL
jgi:hypothetical protein